MKVIKEIDMKEKQNFEWYSAISGETNSDLAAQFYNLFLDNNLDGITRSEERKEFLRKLNYCVYCGIMSDEPCYCEESV